MYVCININIFRFQVSKCDFRFPFFLKFAFKKLIIIGKQIVYLKFVKHKLVAIYKHKFSIKI